MAIYSLPIEKLPINEDDIIDMSKLNFPVDKCKQLKTSFLYLRNTGIKAKYEFDGCSYKEKEEFLMLYMKNNRLTVNMPMLTTTWVRILVHGKINSELDSILTEDEIDKFYNDHNDYINEIYQFLISIPLCSMNLYRDEGSTKSKINMDEFPSTNYFEIDPYVIIYLINYKEIIILSQAIEGSDPLFYIRYFDTTWECYPGFIKQLVDTFPYSSLLNVILSKNGNVINAFVDGLRNLLHIKD